MTAKRYCRVQPAGLPLRGWSSVATSAGGGLPRGHVFAFTSAAALAFSTRHEWCWDAGEQAAAEVVTFLGRDAYDPGDYEGVAVRPGRVLSRVPLLDWLGRYGEAEEGDRG